MGFNPGSSNSSIRTSTDVALNNLQNGQVLTYSASLGKWQNSTANGNLGNATLDLTDRFNDTTETIPTGFTTNCAIATVTKTAPSLASSVGTPPLRWAVKNTSSGTINVTYPNSSGVTTTIVMLPDEALTFRQKSTSGWGTESGNKSLTQIATYLPYNPSNNLVITSTTVPGALAQLDAGAVDYNAIMSEFAADEANITALQTSVTANSNQITANTTTLTQAMTAVIHGSDATVARPIGWIGLVLWFGSVTPNNCQTGDILVSGATVTSLSSPSQTAPTGPPSASMVGGDGSVTLSWTASTDPNLDHYEYLIGGTNPPTGTPVSVASSVLSATVSVSNGTTLYGEVRASKATSGVVSAYTSVTSGTATAPSGSGVVTSGLLARYDAQTITGLSDGQTIATNSTAITDSIGGLLLKGAGGASPAVTYIASSGIGGHPAFRTAASGYLKESTLSQPATRTIILVAKYNAATANAILATTSSNTNRHSIYNDGTHFVTNDGTLLTSAIAVDTAPHVFSARYNGSSSAFRVDSSEVTGNAGSNIGTGTVIGANAAQSTFTSEDFGEILIYNRVLSDTEVTQTVTALRSKWSF